MSGSKPVPVSGPDDLKTKVAKDLCDKGVEPSTANYLADLLAQSERGREILAKGEMTVLGNCTLLGISPG